MEGFIFNFLLIISITGIIQGLFLSATLLRTSKGEKLINRIIVCLLSLFILDILVSGLSAAHMFYSVAFFRGLRQSLRFLYGPVIYFFLNILYFHTFYPKKKDMIHFLPFFFIMLFSLGISSVSPGFISNWLNRSINVNYHHLSLMMNTFFSIIAYFHMSIYLLYSFRKMNTYIKAASNNGGNIFKIYKTIILFCSFYTLSGLIISSTQVLLPKLNITAFVLPFFITIIIYFLEYMIIFNPEMIFIKWEKESHHNPVYKKIHLSRQKVKEYLERLFLVMEKEKLYKDPDLTLPSLADRVHLSRNLLSYLLNSVVGTNFYDFINGFRVEAVKTFLADTSLGNESILNLAFIAGFNSKSAFNKIFKKNTNMSPSEYKRISMTGKKESRVFSKIMEMKFIRDFENNHEFKSAVGSPLGTGSLGSSSYRSGT